MTRRTSAALVELRGRLAPRDLELLGSLDSHRFLTTNQIARLHFDRRPEGRPAIRATTRVLGRLEAAHLVERLDRQIGGVRAGSASTVWTLTTTGERLLRVGSDRAYQRTRHTPSLDHLAHVLAIAEVHLLLIELARDHHLELLKVELEPACWRPTVGSDGVRLTLKPDLAVTTATGDYEDSWFIEVDRGRAGMSVLLRKCAQYTAYARTGREQTGRGVFPAVLWLLPTEARVRRLAAEVARAPDIDPTLLRFATPAGLAALLTPDSPGATTTTDFVAGTSAASRLGRLLAGGAHERF